MSADPRVILKNVDWEIVLNLIVSLSVIFVTFVLLAILRPLIPLFSANMLNKPKRRRDLEVVHAGRFTWILSTFRVPDPLFLAIAGLDGFVFVQVLRLLLTISFLSSLLLVPLLGAIYFTSTTDGKIEMVAPEYLKLIYTRFSIDAVAPQSPRLWATYFGCLLFTAIVTIGVWTFYRHFVSLRQAYLASPSTFVSSSQLHVSSLQTGSSLERIQSLHNYAQRSIILDGISNTYTRPALIEMLSRDIGPVDSLVFVKSRSNLSREIIRRNSFLVELENSFLTFYAALFNHLKISESLLKSQFPDEFETAEKLRLMEFALSANFWESLRPIRRPHLSHLPWNTDLIAEDAILYYSRKLVASELAINLALDNFCSPAVANYPDIYKDPPDDSMQELSTKKPKICIDDEDWSLKSSYKLGRFRKATTLFTDLKLTLWGSSTSAVVTFKRPYYASIAIQCLLSNRPFSFIASRAPEVTNLIWSNLYMAGADRFVRGLLGDIVFVLMNLFYSTLVGLLVGLSVQLEASDLAALPIFGWLSQSNNHPNKLMRQTSNAISHSLQGITEPLIFTILLSITPSILYATAIFQGSVSAGKAQESVMRRYMTVLFIQTFLVTFAGSFVLLFVDLIQGHYQNILKSFQHELIPKSAFFLNVILQKASIGLAIEILQVIPLIKLFITYLFSSTWSVRKRIEVYLPTSMQLGWYYPDNVLMVYLIMAAFITVAPVFGLVGAFYFGLAYFVFRSLLIFSYRIEDETGGEFWSNVSWVLLFGCLLNQAITAIELIARSAPIQAALIIPITLSTLFTMRTVQKIFHQRLEFQPITNEQSEEIAIKLKAIQQVKMQIIYGRTNIDDPRPVSSVLSPLPQTLPLATRSDSNSDRSSVSSINDLSTKVFHAGEFFSHEAYEFITFDQFLTVFKVVNAEAALALERAMEDAGEMRSSRIKDVFRNPYYNPIPFRRTNLILLPHNFFSLVKYSIDKM